MKWKFETVNIKFWFLLEKNIFSSQKVETYLRFVYYYNTIQGPNHIIQDWKQHNKTNPSAKHYVNSILRYTRLLVFLFSIPWIDSQQQRLSRHRFVEILQLNIF